MIQYKVYRIIDNEELPDGVLLTNLKNMNASEKAKELYEQANYLDHSSNGVYTMTHNQRKHVAIRISKEVLATLDSPPIRNGQENHMLWKATVDYWNDVLFACGVL
jgi:hypothetical protein